MAVRIMRKLYEATGGKRQRWESLGSLGAGKVDAPGIAYAVEGIGSSFPAVCTRRGSPRTDGSG
jgi:hypothetical protein